MDLLIRAGRDDHKVIEHLCAPVIAGLGSPRSLPLTGLVVDAPTIVARPQLRTIAQNAGLPLLIDPLTPLLQDTQAPKHAWARLPYATPDKVTPEQLNSELAQDRLIDGVIGFQREHGSTVLIPPYPYIDKRSSGWFPLTLQLLQRTARYLDRESIDLPVAPVFAASLREFGPHASWPGGIDRFTALAASMNLRHVNLSLSWSDPRNATYNALALLITTGRHVSEHHRTIAWRQGLYGAALTAAGLNGYETGPGPGEACHYPAYAAARRPTAATDDDENAQHGGSAYTYFTPFNRSVQRRAGQTLLADPQLRGSLVCDAETCCPDGATSMINSWRHHAIRARAREIHDLAAMPATAWRLNKVARAAELHADTARLATDLLRRSQVKGTVPHTTFRALSRVADELRTTPETRVA